MKEKTELSELDKSLWRWIKARQKEGYSNRDLYYTLCTSVIEGDPSEPGLMAINDWCNDDNE